MKWVIAEEEPVQQELLSEEEPAAKPKKKKAPEAEAPVAAAPEPPKKKGPKKQKVIDLYEFDDLSERAKDKVRDKFSEWSELDMFKEDAENQIQEAGFDNPEVQYSFSYSQGDGLCFEASVDATRFMEVNGLDPKFKAIAEYLSIRIKHSGHYSHSNSTSTDWEITNDVPGDQSKITDEQIWDVFLNELFHENGIYARDDRRTEVERAVDPYMSMLVSAVRGPKGQQTLWDTEMERDLAEKGIKNWDKAIDDTRYRLTDEPKVMMDEKEVNALAEEFMAIVEEKREELCDKLEKQGYAELEYQRSDEYIRESCEANDYTFEEDGTLA